MSILIKGMEMPTSCGECRFAVDGWCYAYGKPNIEALSTYERANFCPLVAVPAHGRLIDADAVQETVLKLVEDGWNITRNDYKRMDNILFECPTIIPADKEDKDA